MTAGDEQGGRTRGALVTGGTGGMGRAIAAKLAADGFDVAVAYTGRVDLADAAVKKIAEQGRRGAAFAADVADEEAVSALFDAAQGRFGHLDVVRRSHGAPLTADDLMTRRCGVRAALIQGSDGHRFLIEERARATPQPIGSAPGRAPSLRAFSGNLRGLRVFARLMARSAALPPGWARR